MLRRYDGEAYRARMCHIGIGRPAPRHATTRAARQLDQARRGPGPAGASDAQAVAEGLHMIAYRATLDVHGELGFRPRDPGRQDHPLRPLQRTGPQLQGRGYRLVVFRQGTHARRQHPGGARARRVPAVGLRRGAGLGARHHRRTPARLARALPRRRRGAGYPGRSRLWGAGIGIHVPVRQPSAGELDISNRTRNALQRSLRCLGEHGFALLTGRWRALQHITLSPSKIGDTVQAALVLTISSTVTSHMNFAEITSLNCIAR
jgi:hypothetical protein